MPLDKIISQLRFGKQSNYRPLVYVSATNIELLKTSCRLVVNHGAIPLAPALLLRQFMNPYHPQERRLMQFIKIVLMRKCQEVWLFGTVSREMKFEAKKAKKVRQPVRYFNHLQEV